MISPAVSSSFRERLTVIELRDKTAAMAVTGKQTNRIPFSSSCPLDISDDEYFSQMVRDDLNLIIRDIREAHKKDSESAPQTTVANELKENLEAVENFKGSRDEKLVVLYCKQLGINYKNLSDEEFRWLIRILKKSKKMGTPISQRKKR